jgi:hypothetical protein
VNDVSVSRKGEILPQLEKYNTSVTVNTIHGSILTACQTIIETTFHMMQQKHLLTDTSFTMRQLNERY